MSIDGIGKPPAAGGAVPSGVQGAERPRQTFAVQTASPSAASPLAGSSRVSSALSGLQRGELTLDQYLDARVEDATSHLTGKLSADQMQFVKQSLREQLATDPVLVELVQRTTSGTPAAELR